MRSALVTTAGLLLLGSPARAENGATPGSASTALETFNPFPESSRDLEDRVIVRFRVGYDPVFAGLSGEADTQANPVSEDDLRTQSLFLNGDLALGTRGIGFRTLNTYFLGGVLLDLDGEAGIGGGPIGEGERPAATTGVIHRFDDARQILFHLAYGEIDGFTREGALSHAYVRAGRQFHFGIAPATFDGGTLGYRGDALDISVRAGRRAAAYNRIQDDPGLLFGAAVGYDFGGSGGTPLSIHAEVLHFMRDVTLTARDIGALSPDERTDLEGSAIGLKATLAEVSAEYEISKTLLASARISFVSPELSHVRLGAEWSLGDIAILADFDQKVGRDLLFDLASTPGVTRNETRVTYETFRLNIPDLQPYSDLLITALVPLGDWLELDASPGIRILQASEAETTPFDASRLSWGAGLHGRFVLGDGNGLEADASYTGLLYLRGNDVTGTFRDNDMGGETLVHEITAGLRYMRGGRFLRRRMLGSQTVSAGASGFLRSSAIDGRLVDKLNEATFGAIVDARWSFSDYAHIQVTYEFARDSKLFVPELSSIHGVRAGIEGRF